MKTHSRDIEGRYVVKMPLKADPNCLGNSRGIALKRLNALWITLERDPQYLKLYREFMQEYEQLGHMREVTVENDNPKMNYFLPHHDVYRPEKSTTKVRVVFNASSPTNNGLTLNDIQLNGGVIQDYLYAQMIRFRTFRYALTADINKMYRMILIDSEQRCLQQILWKDNKHDRVKTYELQTVPYGMTSAPYLVQRTLR
ncbi:integrase catalytic domain-containing protein [Trichonephila clavipes]|nr:integrase catalytic domain-containing protein [Trichonephila clavipes]